MEGRRGEDGGVEGVRMAGRRGEGEERMERGEDEGRRGWRGGGVRMERRRGEDGGGEMRMEGRRGEDGGWGGEDGGEGRVGR